MAVVVGDTVGLGTLVVAVLTGGAGSVVAGDTVATTGGSVGVVVVEDAGASVVSGPRFLMELMSSNHS